MPFIRSTTVLAELRRQGERWERLFERQDRRDERLELVFERLDRRDERLEHELQIHRKVMAEGIAAIRDNSRAVDEMRVAIDDMRQDVHAQTDALLLVLDHLRGPEGGHAAA